ncbi:MAG: DUF2811 domain-containing protein [Leptolyngbyaceae cyanobacterium]|mgnify:CR=1 FL=1
MPQISPLQKITPETVLAALRTQQGKQNGLAAAELTHQLCGEKRPYLVRHLREVIMQLRDRGWPICATPEHGYWWAANTDELLAVVDYHKARALASLRQGSRQKRFGIPALEGQGQLFDPELSTPGRDEHPEIVPGLLVGEIPEELHDALQGWLDQHPDWDMDRVAAAALGLLVMQNGDQAAGRIYIDAMFQEKKADVDHP